MKIDLGKLRGNPEAPLLAVDLFMVMLVLFNLVWIIFNTLFGVHLFQNGIAFLSTDFHRWYRDEIHPNFIEYDMIFVAIYVTELLLRWLIAIVRKTYHRWFFYPFIHWYDVLGCIPVGSFRWLRILRVIVLLWRLQKVGVIDLRNTWLVRTARKYLDILTEEISDRVVLNVLDGVHSEIARGNPVVHRISSEVLSPRREALVVWLAESIRQAVDTGWQENRETLHTYLRQVITESMDASADLQRIERVPVIGPQLGAALDAAISDIARHLLDRLARDMTDRSSQARLEHLLNQSLAVVGSRDEHLSSLIRDTLLESIVIVKQHVSVQEWKQREAHGHYD